MIMKMLSTSAESTTGLASLTTTAGHPVTVGWLVAACKKRGGEGVRERNKREVDEMRLYSLN